MTSPNNPSPKPVEPIPCPFCGCKKTEIYSEPLEPMAVGDSEIGHWVECYRCAARGPLNDSLVDPIPSWNRRVSSSQEQDKEPWKGCTAGVTDKQRVEAFIHNWQVESARYRAELEESRRESGIWEQIAGNYGTELELTKKHNGVLRRDLEELKMANRKLVDDMQYHCNCLNDLGKSIGCLGCTSVEIVDKTKKQISSLTSKLSIAREALEEIIRCHPGNYNHTAREALRSIDGKEDLGIKDTLKVNESVAYPTPSQWWCSNCQIEVPSIDVTYEEKHNQCGYPVGDKPSKPTDDAMSKEERLPSKDQPVPYHSFYSGIIKKLEEENQRMREALTRIEKGWHYMESDEQSDIARQALVQPSQEGQEPCTCGGIALGLKCQCNCPAQPQQKEG
jgi:Lar family restriction alleviation protein